MKIPQVAAVGQVTEVALTFTSTATCESQRQVKSAFTVKNRSDGGSVGELVREAEA